MNALVTAVSTGADPDGWRAWWREQSRLDGSDWGSLLRQHREVFHCLCESVGVVMICAVCDRDPCPSPSFCAACCKADGARKLKGDAILRLTRLMDRAVTFEREINGKNRAAASTVEALMFELCGGTKALSGTAVTRRLSELSEQQLHEVCGRLQRLKPEIARAWSPDEIATLVDNWNGCHG